MPPMSFSSNMRRKVATFSWISPSVYLGTGLQWGTGPRQPPHDSTPKPKPHLQTYFIASVYVPVTPTCPVPWLCPLTCKLDP